MDNISINARLQLRNDIKDNWDLNDPVLLLGEIGIETDTTRFKFGDGINSWSLLKYSYSKQTILDSRQPELSDSYFDIGTLWIDTLNNNAYYLLDNTENNALWEQIITQYDLSLLMNRIDDIESNMANKADLGEDGKVVPDQLPEIILRNFETEPIDLSTEVIGILDIENIPQNMINEIDELRIKTDENTILLNNHIDDFNIHITTTEKNNISYLQGLTGNVQAQIDLLSGTFGTSYIVDTHADLSTITNPTQRDLAFVRVDETQDNATTLYAFTASWEFVTIVEAEVRNFLTNPIDLNSEVTGIIPNLNLPNDLVRENELDNFVSNYDVLTKTNTISYTPTLDYHPATKKYVDEKAIIGSGIEVVDNLDDNSSTNALSSNQGRILNETKEPIVILSTSTTYWNGLKTFVDFATSVRNSILTGFNVATDTIVLATDTILEAIGKLQAQINNKLTIPTGIETQLLNGQGYPITPTGIPTNGSSTPFTSGGAYGILSQLTDIANNELPTKAPINNPVFSGYVTTASETGFRVEVMPDVNGANQIRSLLPNISFKPLEFVAEVLRFRHGYYSVSDVAYDIWHGGNLPVESGVWTPVLASWDVGAIPIRGANGAYQRVGKLVECTFSWYTLSGDFTGHGGPLDIYGFPFVQSQGLAVVNFYMQHIANPDITNIFGYMGAGETHLTAIRKVLSGYVNPDININSWLLPSDIGYDVTTYVTGKVTLMI